MEEYEVRQALRRLTDLWEPWYKIDVEREGRGRHEWHAKRRDNGDQFHADSPSDLNVALIRHFMGDMRLAQLEHVDLAQELALAEVRRKHCLRWDHIGPDTDAPGWRASRQISPTVTHHIVTRTIAELSAELDKLTGPNGAASVN